MPSGVYFGWGLVLPAILALAYGAASLRMMKALGGLAAPTPSRRLGSTVPLSAVFVLWCAVPAPPALFYTLVYAVRLLGGLGRRGIRQKELFLINLTHLLSISLHMIIIGTASLVLDVSMPALLEQPVCRIATLSAVLVVNLLVYAFIHGRGLSLAAVIRTQADGAEMRPFMVFLWFCGLSLLLDSILCSYPVEWDLLPLLLLGSTVLLELYLFRFLAHIYSIMKVRYLEEEHRRLARELEQQARRAEELRSKGDVDTLTGLYSRRYILDRMGQMLCGGEPFSLAYLDLDKLKQINDRDGHDAGDRYLCLFARLVEERLRKSDLFARVGGDEFVILFPNCDGAVAGVRLEQIRRALAGEGRCGHGLSFSYGVAQAPTGGGGDLEGLLKQADQAMYQDKKRQ